MKAIIGDIALQKPLPVHDYLPKTNLCLPNFLIKQRDRVSVQSKTPKFGKTRC